VSRYEESDADDNDANDDDDESEEEEEELEEEAEGMRDLSTPIRPPMLGIHQQTTPSNAQFIEFVQLRPHKLPS
jgi:hypothetical protein